MASGGADGRPSQRRVRIETEDDDGDGKYGGNSPRGRVGTEGSDVYSQRGSVAFSQRGSRYAHAEDEDENRPSRRPRRAHLVTEALGENEELHQRVALLEERLQEQEREGEEQIADLEAEVTRLRELYEPKDKPKGRQKELVMSAVDQMAHDVKMRELHEKIDELHQENSALEDRLHEVRDKCTSMEEKAGCHEREYRILKDQKKLMETQIKSLKTGNGELETRIAETTSALHDEREKARLATVAYEQAAAEVEAVKSKMNHKSNSEHAERMSRARMSARMSAQHVDSLADELGNSSSWRVSITEMGITEEAADEGLELVDRAHTPDAVERPAPAPAPKEEPAAETCAPPPPKLRGFIEKKSPSALLPCNPYQRRFFVLECGRLSWYGPGEDPETQCCRGSVDFVFNPSIVEEDINIVERFSIRPVDGRWVVGGFTGSHRGRILEFRSCDPAMPRSKWIDAIRSHIEYGMSRHRAMLPQLAELDRHRGLAGGNMPVVAALS